MRDAEALTPEAYVSGPAVPTVASVARIAHQFDVPEDTARRIAVALLDISRSLIVEDNSAPCDCHCHEICGCD